MGCGIILSLRYKYETLVNYRVISTLITINVCDVNNLNKPMSELFCNFSPAPQTTDDRLNVKQRHIKCDSPRQEISPVLYSGMTSCGNAYPGGGAVRNSSVPAITGSWTIPCDINLPSLSIPLPNSVTLPLWPLPFQLLLFSGEKPINNYNISQTHNYFIP